MAEKLKVGVVGYGKMGKVYADWFSENENCEVCAVYNHSAKRKSEAAAEHPGAVFYEDWREMIENGGLDIIGICSPTNERMAQMECAIKNHKHVICEKPVCMDMDELNTLAKLLEGYDKKFCVASELKYHPVIRKVTELLPQIGTLFYIDFHYSMYRTEIKWKHLYQSGGGILRELGQHLLDVATIWLGQPQTVYGRNMVVMPGREVEDVTLDLITYESGAVVNLVSHYFDHTANTYRGSVYGTRGQIDFELSSYDTDVRHVTLYVEDGPAQKIEVALPEAIDRIYPGHMDSFRTEIGIFVDEICSGKPIVNDLGNEFTNMSLIDGSYVSEQTKQPVSLPIRSFSSAGLKDVYTKFESK